MKFLALCLLAATLALSTGCMREKPPTGTPVELTDDERRAPVFQAKKEWYAWHRKGLKLRKDERYEEALYCFHQALAAWPPVPSEDEENAPGRASLGHEKQAGDTLLQLGFLYVDLNNPKWAKHYLDEFEAVRPSGAHLTTGARKKIAEMAKAKR